MSPFLIPIVALLIPIVAILAGTYLKVEKMKTDAAALPGRDGALDAELEQAKAERDYLFRRVEALEAIVTSDGFDVEREARRAGITGAGGRIDPTLLDPDRSAPEAESAARRRARDGAGG